MSDDPLVPNPDEAAKDPFDAPAIAPSEVEPFSTPKAAPAPSWDASEISTDDVPPFAVEPPKSQPKATPTKPRCATHPERFARSVACARCGNYACEACFSIDNDAYCSTCSDRVGMVVPWENSSEGGVFRRLFHTCTHLAQAPFERFGNIGDGDLGRAMSFTATIATLTLGSLVLLCSPFLGLGLLMLGMDAPASDTGPSRLMLIPVFIVCAVIFPFVIAAMHMLLNLLWGSIYHAAAKLAGGQASYISSLRVAQYQSILIPVDLLISFVSNFPLIGPMISLGWLAAKNVLCIFAFAGHATKQHRLEGATAWIVASVPALAGLCMFVALCVLMFAFMFSALQQGESF